MLCERINPYKFKLNPHCILQEIEKRKKSYANNK